MADTGFKVPTGTGISGGSNWVNWSINFINSSNDSRATNTTLLGSDTSATCSDFSFGIPGGSVQIDGIEVAIEGRSETAGRSGDVPIQLSWNGGTNYTSVKTQTFSGTTDSTYTYGGAADTWGRTWSASEFDNANFVLRVNFQSGDNRFGIGVDLLQIKVYYTLLNPSPNVNDQITVSESIEFFNSHRNISSSDSVSVAESISFFNSHRNISKSESISVAESVTMRVISYINVKEDIDVYESGLGSPQTFSAIEDSFYGTSFSAGPNGSADNMHVGGWGDHYYSFLKFDLSGISTSVGTAKLKLTQIATNTISPAPLVYRITADWDEDTLTRTVNPAFDAGISFGFKGNFPNAIGTQQADITQFVGDWATGATTNYGVTIRDTANNPNSDTQIATKEHATTEYRPSLIVTPGVTMVMVNNISKSESISVAESVSFSIITGNLTPSVSDSVSVAEAVTMRVISYESVSDSVSVAESVSLDVRLSANVSDAVTVAENVTLRVNAFPSVSDAVTVSESVTMRVITYVNVSDSVSVAEAVATEVRVGSNVSDSITVIESITIKIPTLLISVSESVGVAESVDAYTEEHLQLQNSRVAWGLKIVDF